jgi:uncharacterized protein
MDAQRIDELRQKAIPILRPYGLARLAVFGSYARGEETDGSDIDLLVRLKPHGQRPTIGLKWFALERELGELLGRPVELVTEDALSPHIKNAVDADKVVLYEE